MKIAKKKATPKTKKKKPVVLPTAAPPEYYRVDLEVSLRRADGTTEYTYMPQSADDLDRETAEKVADGYKSCGLGGRIVHLEGSPSGKVILTWANIEREAEAEKIEKAALEGKKK